MSETFDANALPLGAMVQEYRIVEVLGAGGFGIVYKAENVYLPELVAIKEFLPVNLCRRADGTAVVPLSAKDEKPYRWALRKFLKEARLLYELSHPRRHPNIICVSRFHESNGTAYITMDFEEGRPLSKTLGERDPATEAELYSRALTVQELRERTLGEHRLQVLLDPLLDGLTRVHGVSIWHRDIKPANILVRLDGSPVLIDFGAARQEHPDRTRSILAMYSPAYAAPEHVMSKGEQGPWTDIYSLGATAYRAIAGKAPTAASQRALGARHITAMEAGAGRYSDDFLGAIDAALSLSPKDRPQSARAWRSLLEAPASTAIRSQPRRRTTSTEPYIGATTVSRSQPWPSTETSTEPYIGETDVRPNETQQPRSQPFHAATSAKDPQGRFRLPVPLSAIMVGIAVAILVFIFVIQPQIDREIAKRSSPEETPIPPTNGKRDRKHLNGSTPPGIADAPLTTNTKPLTQIRPHQEQTTIFAEVAAAVDNAIKGYDCANLSSTLTEDLTVIVTGYVSSPADQLRLVNQLGAIASVRDVQNQVVVHEAPFCGDRSLRPAIEARERMQATRRAAEDVGVPADSTHFREGQRQARAGETALADEDSDTAENAFQAAALAFEHALTTFRRKIDEDRRRAEAERQRLEAARMQEAAFCAKVASSTNRSALKRYLQEKPQGLCWDQADRRRAELLEQGRYAQLVIHSNVAKDSVFINGERSGPTGPNPHRLRKGKRYEIRVEKQGYQPWTITIGKLDDDMVLRATLTRIPPQGIGATEAPLQKASDRSLCDDLKAASKAPFSDLRAYLEKFPSGFCSGWARERVEALHKVSTIRTQCNDLRREVPTLCQSNRDGCLEGNCQNGFGIRRYKKGNCYWGDWVSGVKQGNGGWYIPMAGGSAEVLYGEVSDGKVISGVYASASGNCFVGRTDPETREHVRGTLVFLDGGIRTIGDP